MSLSGNFGRPVKLKVPAEYNFHKLSFAVNKPLDEGGLPRAVPELTPVDPSVASTSTRTESSNLNVSRNVVVDNVAVPPEVRHDAPSGDVEEPEAIVVLPPARKRVRRNNTAAWMRHFIRVESNDFSGAAVKRVKCIACSDRITILDNLDTLKKHAGVTLSPDGTFVRIVRFFSRSHKFVKS